MTDGLLFANAVAKAKENNLFSEERLARLIDCDSLADAVKILAEVNYGGGIVLDSPQDFEKALAAEEALAVAFLKELKLENGADCFLLKFDYHNIKSVLKEFYGGGTLTYMLEGGFFEPSKLKEMLTLDDPNINPHVDSAIKAIRKAFEIKKSPRLIDTMIDKAMFKDIAERLKRKNTDNLIKRYFVALADLTNIYAMLRSLKIGGDFAFFEASFAEGGEIPLSEFASVYSEGEDKLAKLTNSTLYAKVAAKYAEGGLPGFNAAMDNFLLDIFREGKNDLFSSAPVVGYFLAKKQEIKMLRIALVCIKNGVGKAEIRKRMRSMYA